MQMRNQKTLVIIINLIFVEKQTKPGETLKPMFHYETFIT